MIANLYGRGKNMGNNMILKEKGELVKEIGQLLQVLPQKECQRVYEILNQLYFT
jgi:hypothetical protein